MHRRTPPEQTIPAMPAWPAWRAAGDPTPPQPRRRLPPRWLILMLAPIVLLGGILGGVLLHATPPQADAAYRTCAPKIALNSAGATSATVAPGLSATLRAQITASCSRPALVDFEVYDAAGHLAWQQWTNTTLTAGRAATFQKTWAVSASQPAGAYVLRLGVFTQDWKRLFARFNAATTMQVRQGASATPAATGTPIPGTPAPSPTAAPTPPSGSGGTPPAGGATPVGSALPSEAQCAARVPAATWEPRPDNYTANHTVPTAAQIAGLAHWGYNDSIGMSTQADVLRRQITGNYTGTTDQILQWAACKWGVDPNIVRAEAVVESWWRMGTLGDWTSDTSACPPDGAFANGGCYQTYGILQVKWQYSKTAWPMSRYDTAFGAEYMYGIMRACYEGWIPWLGDTTPVAGYARYHAGDLWGCIGYWFSGSWYSQGALDYIAKVKDAMANKTWLQRYF